MKDLQEGVELKEQISKLTLLSYVKGAAALVKAGRTIPFSRTDFANIIVPLMNEIVLEGEMELPPGMCCYSCLEEKRYGYIFEFRGEFFSICGSCLEEADKVNFQSRQFYPGLYWKPAVI